MALGEEIVEALQEFVGKLERGERIVATSIERCGCDGDIVSGYQSCCHLCSGTGYIRKAVTILPEVEQE